MSHVNDWSRIKQVLEGALARDGAEQRAYVAGECGDDAALRAEVEALLSRQGDMDTFLETPAALLFERPPEREDLSGRTVGAYRVLSRIGAGGMGEVYLAHDDKLDRPVALKFLSREFAADRDRVRRFHQEARAASSLNHPHILVVHDVDELDGRLYIVTEFVEGETLRARLGRGPLPAADVLDIGVQLAGALAAAHARGLVHRDIKPENVMLRPDGYVKVLDFGLAKLATPVAPADGRPTPSHTRPGAVIGTPRYMSPEQVRGLELDARSDVWSLAVVLHEMATGVPAFDGPTDADVMAAILAAEPRPLGPDAADLGPAFSTIVSKALRKDRIDRFADATELVAELRRVPPPVRSIEPPVAATDDFDGEAAFSPSGERRRAIVVVSLLSEYASLVERLAPARVEEVVGRVRAAAVDAMRRYGGVVNQSIGEEIVSLFGIPRAHEDDELRAVRATLELHARAREISASAGTHGTTLCLQSGLHAGTVVARRLRDGPRRYAVTGSPMETASRLAAAAERDGILVSSECQRRVAPFVRTEPRPPVAVHRDAPPVAVQCVVGESGLDSRLDAPERGRLTPFSGRGAELAALQAQAQRARDGEGSVVIVTGEAGSGKSRMLHELRTSLAGSPSRILQGRCRASGSVPSYLPFIEAFQGVVGIKDQEAETRRVPHIVARVRAIEPSLEPLIPLYLHLLSIQSEAFPLPRHLRGEHFQAAMLDAFAAIFTSYAQAGPAVLLLEDWHWADEASRQALRHLAEVVPAYPLLIVVTTRPDAATLPGPGVDHVVRITLGPLDLPAAVAIANAVLGVEHVPADLAHRLHERTGGNPFFLEEMCKALREAGHVATDGAEVVVRGSTDTLQLPDSVEAVIRSRLDRLHPRDRDLLRIAAVVGREFARGTVRDAMDAVDITAALERLKAAGIVRQIRVVPDAVYRFKHVLMQQVAYESLVEHQRRAAHRSVGQAIERANPGGGDQLQLLAYHFGQAEEWSAAVDYGVRAADRAIELSQFDDALDMLERVQSWLVQLPEDPARQDRIADVLLRQERLCETLGLRTRQLQLSAELIRLLAPAGASLRLAEAYLRQGDVSTLLKRFDAADRALATSLRVSRECGDAALERNALRSIGLLRWHQGRHVDAIAITENALEIDRQRQDDLAVAGDLSNLGNILRSMGEYHRALEVLDEALAVVNAAGDPIKRLFILHNIANTHRALGDLGTALDYLRTADESARQHMLPIQRSFHLTSMAHIHLQEGRVEESLRTYQEAVDLSRRARHADGLAQSVRMLGNVMYGLGRDRDALPYLREAAQLFAQLEDRDAEIQMQQRIAAVLERIGDAEATAAWDGVRALARANGDGAAELAAIEGAARAARRLSPDDTAVIERFEEALALAARLGERQSEASLHNTLGILRWQRAEYAEALAHYETALGLLRELGDRPHEGLALNCIGVTLARLLRYEEARTALDEALIVNRESGERRLEAHTLAALGDIARTLGRRSAAAAYFAESLAIRRETGDGPGEAQMLDRLARVEADTNPIAKKESGECPATSSNERSRASTRRS